MPVIVYIGWGPPRYKINYLRRFFEDIKKIEEGGAILLDIYLIVFLNEFNALLLLFSILSCEIGYNYLGLLHRYTRLYSDLDTSLKNSITFFWGGGGRALESHSRMNIFLKAS